ncbi:HAMP domain-containing histidine kinase [Thiorhodococcus mannitoliphagus]|uniref:HAMP domain-containing histidine kinase n=1 Tax=Thiorhodococcus mannitoliphagus TaxID=329406 RepID=A0A6P1DW93_9GAMM|nr:HAMP domain-containing sensor histidine kinase [Thiorhodococcus mannitoliphagus]NEX20382.1 HAMP domain-containing histidine kinase [Thiorhodococcus mannitoliphagus]
MDFSDILASSIHDIKNSLGLILSSVDELVNDPNNKIADVRQASLLQHEAQRANNNLIQLLTLYKIGNQQLAARVAEQNLEDFLDEVIANNSALCESLNIQLSSDCDPDLNGYFDADLIRSVLDSTIGNAHRYAKTEIQVNATEEDGYLVIRVEDDGGGFPDSLSGLLKNMAKQPQESQAPGRTQLGLFFATSIAELHQNNGKRGRIELKNGHRLPGGCFELWLP